MAQNSILNSKINTKMKTKQDFQECIQSQEARILKIKVSPLFSDQEKNDMVAECRQEIERINRLQLALAHRELKRSKRTQFVHLKGYETMIATSFIAFIFMISSCTSSRPVYVKNVYLNGVSTPVKDGIIYKHTFYYTINGKKYKLLKIVPTTDSNYVSHF